MTQSLEEVLAGANVLVDEYADYDSEAARRQITHTVAGTLWMGAMSLDNWVQSVKAASGIETEAVAIGGDGESVGAAEGAVPKQPTMEAPWYEQATRDLRTLSKEVINDSEAVSHIARLVNSWRIEPEGALVFACLLHLAGKDDGAQFWWQFAAGAGSAMAAQCLFLLHMGHGELRDAEHWALQTADLTVEPPRFSVRSRDTGPWESFQAGIRTTPGRGAHALHDVLEAAVDRLDFEGDADFGAIPKPDPRLADDLEEYAAT